MIRNKGYCSHVYPVRDSIGKKHSWNIFTSIFMWVWYKILTFSTSQIWLFSFLFSLTKLYLFSLLCSIHLNYLNGAGNLDPEISLWSRTTSLFQSSIFKILSIILNVSLFLSFPIHPRLIFLFHFCLASILFLPSCSASVTLPSSFSLLLESWHQGRLLSSADFDAWFKSSPRCNVLGYQETIEM